MLSPLRTYTLDIDFDGNVSWEDLIRFGTPGTPDDHPIWHLNPIAAPQSGKRKVILASFGRSATSEEIDGWALGEAFDLLFAHENFWIAKEYPQLPSLLGKDMLGLASLRPFDFEKDGEKKRRVATVWWYRDVDKNLYRISHLTSPDTSWNKNYWFSFTSIL